MSYEHEACDKIIVSLKKEIERLTAEHLKLHKEWRDQWLETKAERDQLAADLKKWEATVGHSVAGWYIRHVVADRDRLQGHLQETVKALNDLVAESGDELLAMMRQRDAMQAALERLKHFKDGTRPLDLYQGKVICDMADIAAEALGAT